MSNPVYVADFETTTDPEDCRVWGWGLVTVGKEVTIDDVEVDTTIDLFLDRLSRENSTVYFHNLKFDGMFILDAIMKDGYQHVDDYARKGEFQTLISHQGLFYSITVKWRNGGRTEFRDSMKKLPNMSVARVAKAFKLPMTKLSIDYNEYRSPTHELTSDEKRYIAADVIIIARALAMQFEEGMTKMTVGSDSLAEFKRVIGTKRFRREFPILHPTMDADIRKAYRGGWTYCDPRFQGRIVGPGAVYDVNSLYPHVMRSRLLPYGAPVFFEGPPEPTDKYPLFVVSLTLTARLKKDKLPCIQIKGSNVFQATEYVSVIEDPVTLAMTNVDLALWEEHYDLDILTYNGGWAFRADYGFFNDYIDKWMEIKNESTGGLREIAKLHLNSLYGKFATNPNVTGKVPVLGADGVVKLETGPEDTRDPVYTAMGVFITSYAREITITAAQLNYKHFAYADTDSMHLLTQDAPAGVTVDPDELGAWKFEYAFDEALFWRAKAYSEKEPDGTMHTHIAGLPRPVAQQVTFDDYQSGKVFGGKLLPMRVPGGIVLVEGNFTLK